MSFFDRYNSTLAYTLRGCFIELLPDCHLHNDGTNGIVDLSLFIFSQKAGIYAALKDEKLFNQVRIELGVPAWPNGANLDPAWIHEAIGKNKHWRVPE
ncbi:MAG: DUF2442 domain-containing protein [Nitrosomonas sp.]|nr:DUF2442 domain-containing protein [Nitrosomonas sp.]